MPDDIIRISTEPDDDRFSRFRLIGWWDQRKLANARVLVIGAGALGNEIIKNLALLGIGNLFIADKDTIENSNLSRSVLYRTKDAGKSKAQVAARGAKEIYPDINVHYFHGDIVHDLGLGVYRWADVVIGGLDNREARLSINRNCWKVNRPWIDGAIEQIQGVARVFVPDGPCYECTMSERDWKQLQLRRSCNLLTRAEMEGGKTPTTPTISSIIAGVQCQEAVKLLHGMDTIAGKGWVFQGISADSYITEFQRKPDCYISARKLLHLAEQRLGEQVSLELSRDVLEKLVCPKCKREEPVYESLGKVKAERALCPNCPETRRDVVLFSKVQGQESFVDKPLSSIGVPLMDILIARSKTRAVGFELSLDGTSVLGALADTGLEFA
jgi:adenylyltransferase/sulfurtransferase